MRLILLGAPGAGKGTQAEILSRELGIPTISTGNILRAAMKAGTPVGIQAKSYVEAGKLVPDDVIIGIIQERLAQEDCKQGYILDGVPRTIPQAEALNTMLAERGEEVSTVIGLEVDDDELIKRIIARGQTSGRADDNEETAKKRLETYCSQTLPLKEFYKKAGKYAMIQGMGSIESIFGDIKKAIDAIK